MERARSKFDKDVFVGPWECVLRDKKYLFFTGLLEIYDIRFFIEDHDNVYVVTIPRRSVFRLVDETYLTTLGTLLTEEETGPKFPKGKTWKAWGTPFIKELGDLLFLGVPDKEHQFQYIIFTEDESPEFVSPEPKIDVFPSGKCSEIMKRLFEEDLKTREQVGFAAGKWDPSSKSK